MLPHRRCRVIAALFASLAFAMSHGAAAQAFPASVGQLVANAKKQVKTVTMAEFRTLVEQRQTGLLIDVREPAEYAAGYVPGAINVPRGTIEFAIWPHVGSAATPDLARQMTLYCRTGGRCALAAKSLQELGFANVTAVDMQIEEWVKAGHPFEKK